MVWQASNGNTALLVACTQGHYNVARMLGDLRQIDINRPNRFTGVRPAMAAMRNGSRSDIVDWMLSLQDVDTRAVDERGCSLLMAASLAGNHEAVRSLLARADAGLNLATKDTGDTALLMACQAGHLHVARLLADTAGIDINQQNRRKVCPLHACLANGYVDIAAMLIDCRSFQGGTPTVDGSTPLLMSLKQGCAAVFHRLLATSTDVNQQGAEGQTPLMLSVSMQNVEFTNALLAARHIEPNKKDSRGLTALAHAAVNDNRPMLQLLIHAKGIDVNSASDEDTPRTPLGAAIANGHAATALTLATCTSTDVNKCALGVCEGALTPKPLTPLMAAIVASRRNEAMLDVAAAIIGRSGSKQLTYVASDGTTVRALPRHVQARA